MNGVAHVCTVSDKASLTFEYREWPNDASKGSIDISHKGPCAVYLKKVSSAISDTAAGDGWFKIWDEGYDEVAGKWCTEKLITNNGHLSVALPGDLQGGYYLVRPELLALHQADKTPSDPQFYVGCAQVYLESTGTALPETTVAIPGYVEAGQPPVSFDIWTVPLKLPYPLPGPAIYSPSISGSSKIVAQNTLTQTEGVWPADCVLYNANWCGVELDQYSTATGCSNASKACWAQCTTCYSTAPPTGSINCPIWEAKCTAIDNACNALDYNGPPNYMKQLTPVVQSASLPAAVAAQSGDGSYILATVSGGNTAASAATSASAGSSPSSAATSSSSQAASYGALPAASTAETSSTSTSSAGLSVSTDGSCGSGVTCQGSIFGDCCSSHGYCGVTTNYCDAGCQTSFGTCGSAVKPRSITSTYGMCGRNGQTCKGSSFGECCGPFDMCGSTAGSCGYGCQPGFGDCARGINAMGGKRKRYIDVSEVAMATISTDGTCGNGVTCEGSSYGNCCSEYGFCGSSITYCGYGCQFSYGMCDIGINGRQTEVERGYERSASPKESGLPEPAHTLHQSTTHQRKSQTVSTDGKCGNGVTCDGSPFGSCCSSQNQCSGSMQACGYGCQFDFGMCDIGINGRRNNHLSHNSMRLGHHHRPVVAKVGANEVVMN